jgi:hypothetical protein
LANQTYQFAFSFSPQSLTTSFQQSGGSWQTFQEPNYNRGVVRAGGPNNPNNPNGPNGNYLVVSAGDTILINLQGPAPSNGQPSWSLLSGSIVQVIISQANSPGGSQGFSPFSGGTVYYPLNTSQFPGTWLSDNQTYQFQLPSQIPSTANPGQGNYNRYEITIAFAANDSSGTTYYYSDDPEMDVQGQ